MNDFDKLIDLLVCIDTGERLRFEDDPSIFKKIACNVNLPKDVALDAILANESNSRFYVVLDGVVFLHRFLQFDQNCKKIRYTGLNPFNLEWENDPEWYEAYINNVVSFKLEHFRAHIPENCKNLVELVSSNGALLKFLSNQVNCNDDIIYVGTDIDFWACVDLAAQSGKFFAVCCDAHDKFLKENSIDYVVSNSIHHLTRYDDVFKNVHLALTNGGLFAGVEADGLLARVVIKILKITPWRLVPYSLKEIKSEVDLFERWLSTPLYSRIHSFNIHWRRTLFHICYIIQK